MKNKSIFKSVAEGQFNGTTSGCLMVIKNNDTILLDFQTTNTILNIDKDVHQIYDNSTKIYSTQTTSGKTTLKYETYALANILTVVLSGDQYVVGNIDGACDTPLQGLAFNYFQENNIEYLTLFVTADLELSTTRFLMDTKKLNYSQAKKIAKKITIIQGSTLIIKIIK